MLLTLDHNPNADYLRTALVIAVLLHLLLAAILPDLPSFKIPLTNRDSSLNVLLQKIEEPKPLEQSLNHPTANSDLSQPLQTPSASSFKDEQGEDIVSTEAAPQQQSTPSPEPGASTTNKSPAPTIGAVIRFDRATVKAFAEQETIRYLKHNKDELERFKYSFNSSYSRQRRSKTSTYKSLYGDYHVRSNTSAGDICFVQKAEPATDDHSTNTVYFYRCGKQPQGLNLADKG